MRILVPVDENKNSLTAVNFVASRSAPLTGSAPEIVLFSAQLPVDRRIARLIGAERLRGIYEASAEKVLDPAQRILAEADLPARSAFALGSPGKEIAHAAKKYHADLIVMASRGLPAVRSLFVDSVTPSVLAYSKTPLLVLREKGVRRQRSLHLGIAVDGSSYGWAAIKYVRSHRALFGPKLRITLIHVVPELNLYRKMGFDADKMHNGDFEAAMQPARDLLRGDDIQVDEARLVGDAGAQIAAFAKEKQLDLLVLGSHGRGAALSAVIGSVAMRVAERCRTPLLLVRRA